MALHSQTPPPSHVPLRQLLLEGEVLSKVAGAFAAHSVQEELVTEALKVLFRRGGGGCSLSLESVGLGL